MLIPQRYFGCRIENAAQFQLIQSVRAVARTNDVLKYVERTDRKRYHQETKTMREINRVDRPAALPVDPVTSVQFGNLTEYGDDGRGKVT